jgi:hypothetical protein
MGCHTWTYNKKETQISFDEIYNIVINGLKTNIRKYKKLKHNICNKPNKTTKLKILYNNLIKDLNKVIKDIDNGNNNILYDCYCEYFDEEDGLITFSEGNIYLEIEEYHDMFRVYNYPEKELHSLDETIEFISNEENKCQINDYSMDSIHEFWKKYPNGLICFG